MRDAGEFGVQVSGGWNVDFADAMKRMRRLRAEISPNDSAERFRDLGIDVFFGDGRFTGSDSIEVAGQTLRFKKAVIATGGRAQAPPIPGLDKVDYLTNETIFSLTELPKRIGIIGATVINAITDITQRVKIRVSLIGIWIVDAVIPVIEDAITIGIN